MPPGLGDGGNLGHRIHALREAMGFSLRDLSERSGVSAQMISQVERSETSPTITVAGRMATGLGLGLSQLLRLDEEAPVTVIRKGRRAKGVSSVGHRFEMVTPDAAGQRYEVSLHRLKEGASTGGHDDPPMHEPGSRETIFVQRGAVSLLLDGSDHKIKTGDAVTFDADLPHSLVNKGKGEAEFLAVVSAGLRHAS